MELRAAEAGELEAFLRAEMFAFGARFTPALVEHERPFLQRTRGWVEDGEWVATSGAFPVRLAVPGGRLPAAAITAVAVSPTHRRRGLLRGMMAALLDDARERGEPLAILWAAEASIYGRFGFGMGVPHRGYRIERADTAFRADVPAGSARLAGLLAEPDAAPRLVPIYARAQVTRPGMPTREEGHFRHGVLRTDDEDEPGEPRLVVYEDEGYALYRLVDGGDLLRDIPDGTLTVVELVAVTPAAEASLWRHVLGLDLVGHVVVPRRPPDDALPFLLADPRRLDVLAVDGLWVCVLDVATALAGRRYGIEDRLVLAVDGEAFALEGGPDGAACASSGAAPDLSVSREVLGALYLGGVAPRGPAAAGRLTEHTAGATDRLARMLAWPVAPWCPFEF